MVPEKEMAHLNNTGQVSQKGGLLGHGGLAVSRPATVSPPSLVPMSSTTVVKPLARYGAASPHF